MKRFKHRISIVIMCAVVLAMICTSFAPSVIPRMQGLSLPPERDGKLQQPKGAATYYDPSIFVTMWGSLGTAPGQFDYPSGVAVNATGHVFIADTNNHRVQVFTASGQFVRSLGSYGSGDGQFIYTEGIAIDSTTGHVFVTDFMNYRVQVFTADGQFVTKWGSEGSGDGQFECPVGIAIDSTTGHVYVTDYSLDPYVARSRVQVFMTDGQFVKNLGSYGTGDGQFDDPVGVAVNATGHVYVSDGSNRVQVFTADGQFVTKWGSEGSGDGQFYGPSGIAIDTTTGHVYVTDFQNDRVQVFTADGQFVTKWGSTGSGDGQFDMPSAIAVDAAGHVCVTEYGNNRVQVFGLRSEVKLDLLQPMGDITGRVFNQTPPVIQAKVDFSTTEAEPGTLTVNATINGHSFSLCHTELMGGTLYRLVNDASSEWLAWAGFWANLLDGTYTLNVSASYAGILGIIEEHEMRQIYKITGASWIPLYEMNLTSEVWQRTGGTSSQTPSELYIHANTNEILTLTSPTITLNSGVGELHPFDRIIVQYQTDTDPSNPVSLNVKNNSITQNTFELQAASTEVQTGNFSVSSVISVDQLEFTGLFAETEYFRLLSVAIVRPHTYKPEVVIDYPSLAPSPTLEQLAERVFGSASSPGSAQGVGGIQGAPVIAAAVGDVDSPVGSVIATIDEDYIFYMTLFNGYYRISSEANAITWGEWCDFWNAVDSGGQYLRGEGEYNLTITGIDSINVWPASEGRTSASVLIYRDLTAPSLEVTGIASGQGFAWNESWAESEKVFPSVTLTADDLAEGSSFPWFLYCVGYTFESLEGLENPLLAHWIMYDPVAVPVEITFALEGDADAVGTSGYGTAEWEELEEGPVNVTFAVLDCGGNPVLQSFIILKDCHAPVAEILTPPGSASCTAAVPSFSLSVTERFLTRVQYSFGETSTTWIDAPFTPGTSVTSIQQAFDANAWGNLIASSPEVDNFVIKFRVTDLAGQVVITYVSVNIDALAPRLKLLNPESGTKATAEAPSFLFDFIRDPNLEEVYYTLSGSDTKYYLPAGTISGQIDQAAWDLALNRTVTITFFAIDSFGNVATFATTVTRTDYVGPGDDPNPGFFNFFEASAEVWVILGGVAAVTLVVLSAYYRAIKKHVPKIPPEELINAQMDGQNGGSPA